MPKFKIETSLFEPVTIEVEGGRTFESVPLSPSLVREIQGLEDKRNGGQLDAMAAVVQQVALIFGADVADIEKIDLRILNQILTHATNAMTSKPTGAPVPNAPTPGSEPTP